MYAISEEKSVRIPRPKITPVTFASRAFQCYDGSVEFDFWLNYYSTTRSAIETVERALNAGGQKTSDYLNLIGKQPSESTRGDMAGRISATIPVSILREIYHKQKNNLYDTYVDYANDCSRIYFFLHICHSFAQFEFVLKVIIRESSEFEEVTNRLIATFFGTIDKKSANRVYTSYLRQFCFGKFYSLLGSKKYTTDFLAGYCIGVLDRLHWIRLNNSFWTEETCHQNLKEICSFYQRTYLHDEKFVLQHFPWSIFLFAKKRMPTTEQLYTLYVKQKIYSGAATFVPLDKVIDELIRYEKDNPIKIQVHAHQLKRLYPIMQQNDFHWARMQLAPLIEVRLNG